MRRSPLDRDVLSLRVTVVAQLTPERAGRIAGRIAQIKAHYPTGGGTARGEVLERLRFLEAARSLHGRNGRGVEVPKFSFSRSGLEPVVRTMLRTGVEGGRTCR